jgi:RND family efflux transporter MFP subunit
MPDGARTEHDNGRPGGDGRFQRPSPLGEGEHAVAMDLPPISRGAVALISVTGAVLLGALFVLGWAPHARRIAAANEQAAATGSTGAAVDVIAPKASPAEEDLVLPADVRPNQSTAIFARATGYLKPLPPGIDIGAHVEAGQLIAEIASPDLDAQLEQARAALEQAQAAAVRAGREYALNQSTLTRYEDAFHGRAVAAQDLDEKRTQLSVGESAVKAADANITAAKAAVDRLAELQSFEKIVAPFSGVLTARNYDAGALITETDSAGKELFRIEQAEVLRVGVNVPQTLATEVRVGQAAELLVRNYPGRSFAGTVARWSGAIDAATRTARVEVDVPNKDGQLVPGMYGQVRFHLERERPTLTLPASALVFDAAGMRIAVVEGDHAKFRTVTLGRDFGQEVEVLAGLEAGEKVINNPGALEDGAAVTIRVKPEKRAGS